MKKVNTNKFIILNMLFTQVTFAQLDGKSKDGLRFYLDKQDSSRFIKLNAVNQIWTRYTENNPLTTVNNYSQAYTGDVSIRRVRVLFSGQLTDRISFFTQFGQDNLNYLSNRKAGSFFHDITADYAFIKNYLSVGFGLNGWNGPARFSNLSSQNTLVLDPPAFEQTAQDTYDQFSRRLGIYAKGKIGKLDYRLSAAKPFIIQTASNIEGINKTAATFSALPPNFVYQGYVMYQFLDQESNFTPSTTGTYLGKKNIFNIGLGFYSQKNAMYYLSQENTSVKPDTVSQHILLVAVDVFYDAPIDKDKGNAVSLYASYASYNYGNNFILVQGTNNPANGINTSHFKSPSTYDKNNFGNAFPFLGTGNISYVQAAYKMKDNLFKDQGTLQLYANAQYAAYNRLADPMLVWNTGINWLIRGHNSKFTLDYQNRPYFTEDNKGTLKQNNRYGQLVLQYQIAL
jgi:hypothetical protein